MNDRKKAFATRAVRAGGADENALEIARALEGHPAIRTVYYPGLPGYAGHEVAKRQMNGFGGMVSIELAGGREAAEIFLDNLELFTQAVSLGDVSSLATHPGTTTHQLLGPELLELHGVTPGLVRLSIGIEDPGDLLADIEQALAAIAVST
jgi:methionine-gamma-lyase